MAELLVVDDVTAGYGEARVLDRVSLTMQEGDSIALLGRNGVGKTTLLTTLMGLTRVFDGRIRFRGEDFVRAARHRRARAGIGWVPQERLVFPSLTVDEHLAAVARAGPWNAARAFALFPRLAERRGHFGNQLSGGEQQMLAIARALVTNPRLLLLDEPMEGLAPIIVQELLRAIRQLVGQDRLSMIIVEQHARIALGVTATAIVLERGRVVHRGDSAALAADSRTLERMVAVA
jgi:branched-chain amino acid transport system ATP-binding protein